VATCELPVEPTPPSGDGSYAAAESHRHDDDDSIETYMSRLLQRVRGESGAASAAPAKAHPAQQAKTNHDGPPAASVPQPATTQPLASLDEIKAGPAPERSWNMAALRDLANQTAHCAIETSTLRQQRESALLKLAISLLGIICGLVVMKLSPSYTSPEFISGLVPLCAGLVWAVLTLVLLLRAIRDGSFGDAAAPASDHIHISPDVSADEL
jgi:hypothetical protein